MNVWRKYELLCVYQANEFLLQLPVRRAVNSDSDFRTLPVPVECHGLDSGPGQVFVFELRAGTTPRERLGRKQKKAK